MLALQDLMFEQKVTVGSFRKISTCLPPCWYLKSSTWTPRTSSITSGPNYLNKLWLIWEISSPTSGKLRTTASWHLLRPSNTWIRSLTFTSIMALAVQNHSWGKSASTRFNPLLSRRVSILIGLRRSLRSSFSYYYKSWKMTIPMYRRPLSNVYWL